MDNEEIAKEFEVLRKRTHDFTNKLQAFSESIVLLNSNLEHFTETVLDLKNEVSNFKDEVKKDIKLNTEFRLRNDQLINSLKKGKDAIVSRALDYLWKIAILFAGSATLITKIT